VDGGHHLRYVRGVDDPMPDGHDQHEHDGPHHRHGFRTASRRALRTALVLLSAAFAAETIGGLWSGSLALLADAAHLLTDIAAVAAALLAQWFARRPPDASRSYGFHRVEILAALGNGLTLWLLAGLIAWEAIARFAAPPAVDGWPMVAVAAAGMVVQIVAAAALAPARKESLNVRAAYLHAATDALQSAAVVVVGVAMLSTGWWVLDPLVSLLIAGLILVGGGRIVWEAAHVLLEGTPAGLDLAALHRRVLAVDGVHAVADLHAWSLTTGYDAFSAHVVARPDLTAEDRERLRGRITELLRREFALRHVTLQVEPECTLHERTDCCAWMRDGRPAGAGEAGGQPPPVSPDSAAAKAGGSG
jgi:cobalt-zinc-cadmium efflux system protein